MTFSLECFINEDLSGLRKKNLIRELELIESPAGASLQIEGKRFLNFSSNNYLGLADHPMVKKAASQAALKWGTGSGASRLISGGLKIHHDLEKKIARFKKEESALLFSSGYLANLGAVTALMSEKDLVLLDRFKSCEEQIHFLSGHFFS